MRGSPAGYGLRTLAGRQFLAGLELPVDAGERIAVALEIIEASARSASGVLGTLPAERTTPSRSATPA